MEHAKLPWIYVDMTRQVVDADSLTVADMDYSEFNSSEDAANAAFIVRAVNSHDALKAALKETLEEAVGWLDYALGVKPDNLMDHGWYERAVAALALAGENP